MILSTNISTYSLLEITMATGLVTLNPGITKPDDYYAIVLARENQIVFSLNNIYYVCQSQHTISTNVITFVLQPVNCFSVI